jgi:hypothetical protein
VIYCGSGRCHHSTTLNADWLPDAMPVRSPCSRMVSTKRGMIGLMSSPIGDLTSTTVHAPFFEGLDDPRNAVAGNVGSAPNREKNSALDNTAEFMPTSVELTRVHSPFMKAQASPGAQSVGSPSQLPYEGFSRVAAGRFRLGITAFHSGVRRS